MLLLAICPRETHTHTHTHWEDRLKRWLRLSFLLAAGFWVEGQNYFDLLDFFFNEMFLCPYIYGWNTLLVQTFYWVRQEWLINCGTLPQLKLHSEIFGNFMCLGVHETQRAHHKNKQTRLQTSKPTDLWQNCEEFVSYHIFRYWYFFIVWGHSKHCSEYKFPSVCHIGITCQ